MASTSLGRTIADWFPALSEALGVSPEDLRSAYGDLESDREFLDGLNDRIKDVPEFEGVRFTHVEQLRVYRTMLYLLTRVARPEVFVETGVLNGLGSAFILLGMKHNGRGTLYSIDLPPDDPRILAQGTGALPRGKSPGWAIPDSLRDRHVLRLGEAQVILPQVLAERRPLDVFLHDSDHCYTHMMFEMTLAWLYLRPGGWLVSDNIEQNSAFADLARGVGCPSLVVSSFDTPERTWRHGLLGKPEQGEHLG